MYICRSILQNDGLYFNVFADFVSSVQCVLKNFKSSWQTQLNQAGIVAYGELKDDVFSIKIMFLALMGTLRWELHNDQKKFIAMPICLFNSNKIIMTIYFVIHIL